MFDSLVDQICTRIDPRCYFLFCRRPCSATTCHFVDPFTHRSASPAIGCRRSLITSDLCCRARRSRRRSGDGKTSTSSQQATKPPCCHCYLRFTGTIAHLTGEDTIAAARRC